MNEQERLKLNEGRNYQMGFAFLKRVGEAEFRTVQPISPCKDYLNDVVYAEATGNRCRAYGLSYDKQDIYEGDVAYIAISICECFGGGKYGRYDQDRQNLAQNYHNLVLYINRWEERLGVEGRTTCQVVADNLYLLTVPRFWCQYTYLISAWSLLVRVGQFYDGTTEDLIGFAQRSNGLPDDAYIVSSARRNLQHLLDRNFPVQDLSTYKGGESVHNCGIVGFRFDSF